MLEVSHEKETMRNVPALPTSHHFQLHALADGVYAALATPDGWAISNAGIVDLGNKTVIFDTFLSPQAAADLRSAAETLTGRPVTTVINSHYHNEHVWGNQVFADADLVATTGTYAAMDTAGRQAIAWHQEHTAAHLADLTARQAAAKREPERHQLSQRITYDQAVIDTLPGLTLHLPNFTFDSRLVLRGSQRRVELITYGAGHTQSDALLYLPQDNILFMGDLLTVGCHPYLADGDPGEINRILDMVIKLNPKILLPGQGAIGTLADVHAIGRYMTALSELALVELTYKLESPAQLDEKIAQIAVPTPFAAWSQADFFTANLRFLYHRLLKAYAD